MNKYTHGNQVCKRFDLLYGKRSYADFLRYDKLISNFKKHFSSAYCHLASASGRVEFIGNHTDHNGGKVIGCAVNLDIISAFKPNGSNTVRILSQGYSALEYDVTKSPQLSGPSGLIEGVTMYLQQSGYTVGGFDAYTHSTVPSGAGISSSAAFEMLIATIVNECFNGGKIPVDVMAKAGQFAENKYLNKPCGLLDQGASLAGGITLFDFVDGFSCDKISTKNCNLHFVLVNTGKSHAGLSNLYASIPSEMFAVAKFLSKERLIDVEPQQLFEKENAICEQVGNRPYLRAKHFVEENVRVEQMASALMEGNDDLVIKLINESGNSSLCQLQNCAVDANDTVILDAINFARSLGNVGVRVHGGGFAGTVLCVVKSCDFKNFVSKMSIKYGENNIIPLTLRQIGATGL